jgi:hypothetical protein
MIQFKCWYCDRRYSKSDEKIGQRFTCSCKFVLKVPKRSGGSCRVRSIADWLVQILVCGGGGALLGFGLALLIASRTGLVRVGYVSIGLFAGLPIVGFLAGVITGERGLEWLGRLIREREKD